MTRNDAELLEERTIDCSERPRPAQNKPNGTEIFKAAIRPTANPDGLEMLESNIKAPEKLHLRFRHETIAINKNRNAHVNNSRRHDKVPNQAGPPVAPYPPPLLRLLLALSPFAAASA